MWNASHSLTHCGGISASAVIGLRVHSSIVFIQRLCSDAVHSGCAFIAEYKDAFFETENLVRIACTIPATSAQAEKSFSCLKLIKTHLRTTMLISRLSSLAMISMHPRRAKNLDLDKVVDTFVRLYPNCRIVLV